jgi:hypothetical protein
MLLVKLWNTHWYLLNRMSFHFLALMAVSEIAKGVVYTDPIKTG